jgi:hypothetical protein
MKHDNHWQCALELGSRESIVAGSESQLCGAVRRGADLRVYTEFYFEEHIAPPMDDAGLADHDGLIQEVIDFRQTCLVDDRHVAGNTTTRQPLNPILGFNGNQPRMSLFMYNMTGHQSCATLPLDALEPAGKQTGAYELVPVPASMPKMSETHSFDLGSSSPSRNFIYHMEVYRFWVQDTWTEVLDHDENGVVRSGSWDDLAEAQHSGREIKVAIGGLCSDLGDGPFAEVFTPLGSGFTHTTKRIYEAQTHPVVRVMPSIPMGYGSGCWDVSWVIVRTDGSASIRSLDPYTRRFRDWTGRFPCRWFVR